MRLPPLAVVSESSETLAMDDDQADTVSEGGKPAVTFDSSSLHHEVDRRMPPQVRAWRALSFYCLFKDQTVV